MVKCSAYRCKSATYKKTPGLSFHRFPIDESIKNAWVTNIKLHAENHLQDWQPNSFSLLCSKHFESHLFDVGSCRKRLRSKAIPTIFDELPMTAQGKENLSTRITPAPIERSASGTLLLQEVQNKIIPVASISSSSSNKTLMEVNVTDNETSPLNYIGQKKIIPLASTSSPTKSLVEVNVEDNEPGPSNISQSFPATHSSISCKTDKVDSLKSKIISKNKKIKALRQKCTRLRKKVSQFSDIISELKNKLNQDDIHILKNIPGNNKDFLIRYIKKAQGSSLEKSYTPELRSFALQLHFYSPRAYDFVRNTFNTVLPHPKTISAWYKKINAEPGFTAESFDTLKKLSGSSEHPIYVNLCIDEMAIRKGLVWDGSENKYKGHVDTGSEVSDDSLPLATQALVMFVTAINASWKLPIAYFFIISMTGEQRATFVKSAIKMLYDINVFVCSLTFDGAASNISMATNLGCVFDLKSLKPYFTFKNLRINIFYDPCHMIKLIRNTLGDYATLVDKDNNNIKFDYIKLLHEIQQQKGLHLANKLKQAHVYFGKQKMKVRLATQLLSRSVADALLYCKDNLKLEMFQGCSATIKFIRIVNDAFDILNSRCMYVPGYKKALCASNIQNSISFFRECEQYISNLKFSDGKLVVESGRKTGFKGFIISLQSAINLFDDLIMKRNLRFLPLYKVSQDHLEMFFGLMRARGGYNDNPNVIQFRTAYKKNITRCQLKLRTDGKLVDLPILSVSSTTDVINVVNNTTPTFERHIMEVHDMDEEVIDFFLDDVINAPLDEYSQEIVVYIAGFIARKVIKKINCFLCQILLLGEKETLFSSLIHLKDRGGLTYPSQALIKVVNVCEKSFKIYKSNSFNCLIQFVCDYVDHSIFTSNNADHDKDHIHLLIKIVVKFYIDLRCKHVAKESNTTILSQRNYLKKIILFQNK